MTSMRNESEGGKRAMCAITIEPEVVKSAFAGAFKKEIEAVEAEIDAERNKSASAIQMLIERDWPDRQLFPNFAFIGKAGAGKTTAADFLVRDFGYVRQSFATLLKQVAHQIWGEGANRDRSKLQPLGTLVRDIDPDAWVNALMRDLEWIREPVVIDDCRFPNEYWALKQRGFIIVRVTASEEIRVDRLQRNRKFQSYEQLEHISERAIDDLDADYTIRNESDNDWFERRIWETLNKELKRS